MSKNDEQRRIYHPTMNEFRDIPAAVVDGWKATGWRLTNPGHVKAVDGLQGPTKAVTDTFPYRVGDMESTEKASTLDTVNTTAPTITPATPR